MGGSTYRRRRARLKEGAALGLGRARWLAPAALPFGQQPLHQGVIGVWRVAVTSFGVPASALLAIAAGMRQAKVEQIIAASQAARLDMLDVGPKAAARVKTQPALADQAFAGPEAVFIVEGVVGLSDAIFLGDRHRTRGFLL